MTAEAIELRPRSLPELLDASVRAYRDHFLHFLAVAALVNLPLSLLSVLAASALFSGQAPGLGGILNADDFDPAQVIAAVALALGTTLLAALANTFALGALLYSLQERLDGHRPGVGAAYRRSLGRVPALIGARLLYYVGAYLTFLPAGLAFLGGGVLLANGGEGGAALGGILIVLGMGLGAGGAAAFLWLWVRWRFHAQTSVLERANPIRALGRSQEVIAGSWWRTFFFLILKFMFVTAVSATPAALVSVPTMIFGGPLADTQFWVQVVTNSVNALTAILLLPLEVIAVTLLYYDYRVRREGLDLQRALTALQQEEVRA